MSERHPSVGSRRLIGCFGASGTGKTQTLRALSREWTRILSFDKSRELAEGVDVHKVAHTRDEVLDYLEVIEDRDTEFSIAYQPDIAVDEDNDHEALKAEAAECGFLARLAMAAENCLFTVDECSRSCRVNYVSRSTVALALEGRKRDVSGIFAGQRPVHVVPDIRYECYSSEVYVFRLKRKADREDIDQEHGRALSDVVRNLPDLHGLKLWRTEDGERIDIVRVVPDNRNPEVLMLGEFDRKRLE